MPLGSRAVTATFCTVLALGFDEKQERGTGNSERSRDQPRDVDVYLLFTKLFSTFHRNTEKKII